MPNKPTPKSNWVKVGDACEAGPGSRGTVLRVKDTGSVPYALVRWSNGATGRHTITTLTRLEPAMILPTIHLNGSGKAALRRQYFNAYEKLFDAVKALQELDIHDRDYYPQGDSAGPKAREENHERIEKVDSVLVELETLLRHVED